MSEHDTHSISASSPVVAMHLLPEAAFAADGTLREVLVDVALCAGDRLSFDLTGTSYALANGQLFKNGAETGLGVGLHMHDDLSAQLQVTGVASAEIYASLLHALQVTGSAHDVDVTRALTLTVTDLDGASRAIALSTSVAALPVADDNAEAWNATAAKAGDGASFIATAPGALDLSDLLAGGTYQPGLSPVDHFIRVDHMTGDVFVDKTGGAHFHTAAVATVSPVGVLDTLNVILHDSEGARVVHSS